MSNLEAHQFSAWLMRTCKGAVRLGGRAAAWLVEGGRWEKIILLSLILLIPFLAFYNLEFNPRSWHDEGSYLTLAKTLVEEGIYAIKTSDGYQTFGAVQSVGPTVILPIALIFRFFGIGLVQARIIAGIYILFTLIVIYLSAKFLFNPRTGLFAIILVIMSPAVSFLLFGRQVLGDIPAIGLFLAGWLLWAKGLKSRNYLFYLISGLFIGAAMITKSQYLIMGFGTIVLLSLLDIFYFRQGQFKGLGFTLFVALSSFVAWTGWQLLYFGSEIFTENSLNLRLLASSTTGFYIKNTIEAFQYLVGSGSGHFYLFWGFLALVYVGFLSLSRDIEGLKMAFLWAFTILWLSYYTFWIIPWPPYIIAPSIVVGIFVAKLLDDLLRSFTNSSRNLWEEIKQIKFGEKKLSTQSMTTLGTLVALLVMGFYIGFNLQSTIRMDILDRIGQRSVSFRGAGQFSNPQRMADYLNETVAQDSVIETWERELGVLTDHNYHYPDQSILAQTHASVHRGEDFDYVLKSDYFSDFKPKYVVIGWWARLYHIYDENYINMNGELVATIGTNDWRYDVYQLNSP